MSPGEMKMKQQSLRVGNFVAAALLMIGVSAVQAATTVNLRVQRAVATLPNGSQVPMWQYCGTTAANSDATASASAGTASGAGTSCSGGWAPGPTLTVPAGDTLTINLANTLSVPTSVVVIGQLGGGLGGNANRMASPSHAGQGVSTFPTNTGDPTVIQFSPPAQTSRIKSFGDEVAPGTVATPTTKSFTWNNLKPGTYLYETGTLPSLQAPMGLYGLLVVTQGPTGTGGTFTPGNAYPGSGAGVPYDADVALLFSEIDPVQNAQVDKAAVAGTDMARNLRFDDPICGNACYPAAVNYAPTYFLINGQAFDRTAPALSSYALGSNLATGNVLVRFANAGLRTHIPSIVGLPLALMAEDGNLAPGKPKVQNEVLLTAGKTYDVIASPSSSNGAFSPATFPVFDRSGSLSTDNHVDGGMQAFLLINGSGAQPGAQGALPLQAMAQAIADYFSVPQDTMISGNVKTNDIGVKTVAMTALQAQHGLLALNADGSFTYTPNAGFRGIDSFVYSGNGGVTMAMVTLKVGSDGPPVAKDDSFTSNVATLFHAASPGILSNDTDPANYAITVDAASILNGDGGVSCSTLDVHTDGSFSAAPAAGQTQCQFSYAVKNSQGTSSAKATVRVAFATGSGLKLNVVDAKTGQALTDYRWILQEDLTFKPDTSGTPSLSTRTLGTSFHRSYNTVTATGCVGQISCGSGQRSYVTASGTRVVSGPSPSSAVSDVALDPNKHYYLSVLPGDAQNPVINGGGAPVAVIDPATGLQKVDAAGKPVFRQWDISKDCGKINDPADPCGHMMGGANVDAAAGSFPANVTISLQRTPLVPAQLSIFIYEDNAPANGQYDTGEVGLGGFNIILFDPAGRPGDPAGQQTYDAFNMPITNALLGTPGCPD